VEEKDSKSLTKLHPNENKSLSKTNTNSEKELHKVSHVIYSKFTNSKLETPDFIISIKNTDKQPNIIQSKNFLDNYQTDDWFNLMLYPGNHILNKKY